MAHMASKDLQTEMFGFYTLSDKATTFFGSALLATPTEALASQRTGMATVFFMAGGFLLTAVRPPKEN